MRAMFLTCALALAACGSGAVEVDPGNVAPNNVSPNNVTSNNVTPNNVTPNNSTPDNGFTRNSDPGGVPTECTDDAAAEVYQRRVEPLVTGGQPSTCNQCHLSSVDLAMFVQDTPCQSMACLASLDLVDFENPPQSRILEQILLAQPTELITEAVIQAEHDGFLDWIEFSARGVAAGGTCHDALCGEIANPCSSGGGAVDLPTGVQSPLGSCTEEALGKEFQTLVYSSRDRCAGCHNPDGERNEADKNPVYWLDMDYSRGGEYGAAVRTMYNMIGRGYVTPSDPAISVMLLKPLPEALGGVPHEGGDKLASLEDATYLIWLDWITMYAECYQTGGMPGLPDKPYISIFNEDRTIGAGEAINFNGRAIDPQDGELPVEWTSDRDGPLGGGNNLANVVLSGGQHTITLTATDSDANTVTDTTTVTVQ